MTPDRDEELRLGFARQSSMSRWLSPTLLLRAAQRVVISTVIGEYNDKREEMAALKPNDLTVFDGDELWFDYVSDLGDAFAPTYAVASLLARPTLDLDGPKPRGDLLVMGGDQCYPTASTTGYEDKTVGPYRSALPSVSGRTPLLYVLPGNHDWYDGLTSFMRIFCQGSNLGAWQTQQTRSYFAVQLPHRWWLWAIDIQFDSYIDDPQRLYFLELARTLQPGDAVILCSAKPSWIGGTDESPETYAVLDYFERTIIRPTGAVVRVSLSGDRHHYARYTERGGTGQKVTAGGGGAYLSSTHHLPDTLLLPPAASRAVNKTTPPATYDLQATYPTSQTSERLAFGVLRLPWTTKGLGALLGAVYVALVLAIGSSAAEPSDTLSQHFSRISNALRDSSVRELFGGVIRSFPALLVALLLLGAAVAFTKAGRTVKGALAGLVHGAAHIALAVLLTALLEGLLSDAASGWHGSWLLLLVLALLFCVGGFLGAELMAGYLLIADKFLLLNINELFAAQGRGDYKNFLRLHIDGEGTLTIYPVKVPDPPASWDLVDNPSPGEALFRPTTGTVGYGLIEAPFRVPHDAQVRA